MTDQNDTKTETLKAGGIAGEKATENVDFHEAAIIDENGNEVAITEDMVRQAIHKLDEAAYPEADENS